MNKKYSIEYPSDKDLIKTEKYAIEYFGIPDNDMVASTPENDKSLIFLNKNCFVCFKKDNEPIAWSLVLPSSKTNAERFIKKEINEKKFFEESIKKHSFETLYLFVAVVLPEHREQGLAKELMSYQIKYFQNNYGIKDFYAWIFSNEGLKLLLSLKRELNLNVKYISKIK